MLIAGADALGRDVCQCLSSVHDVIGTFYIFVARGPC